MHDTVMLCTLREAERECSSVRESTARERERARVLEVFHLVSFSERVRERDRQNNKKIERGDFS